MPAKTHTKRTERILSEAKKRKAKKKILDVEEQKVKVVIFKLGNDYYAFYGKDIKDILRYEEATYVPGSPDYILGIINVRGDIESILSIHKLMGLQYEEASKDTRIAIAENEEVRSGILVDSVEEVMDLPISAIKSPISTIDKSVKEYVAGEIVYNDKHITLLDIGKIFKKIKRHERRV